MRPWRRWRFCNHCTYRAHFFSCAVCQRFCPSLLSVLAKTNSSHLVRLIPRTRVAQAQHEAWNIVSCPKVFTSPRAMSYVTSLMSGTPSLGTCTPSLAVIRPASTSSFSSNLLPGEIPPCTDLPTVAGFSTSVSSSRTAEFEGMEDLMCQRRRPKNWFGLQTRARNSSCIASCRVARLDARWWNCSSRFGELDNCQIGCATALAV